MIEWFWSLVSIPSLLLWIRPVASNAATDEAQPGNLPDIDDLAVW